MMASTDAFISQGSPATFILSEEELALAIQDAADLLAPYVPLMSDEIATRLREFVAGMVCPDDTDIR